MPANKNAVIRYKFLDELLSDRHHNYTMEDITDKVNDRLEDMGYAPVVTRTLEKDLAFLQDRPFCIPLERVKIAGRSCIRYANKSYSIFSHELSAEEMSLLYEVLNTVGQFSGLPNFDWLDGLRDDMGLKKHKQILSFSNNPLLKNSNILASLYEYVANECVLKIVYKKFSDLEPSTFILHPYLLKEYNNRWYIIGGADCDKKILNFALDRIETVTPLAEVQFIPFEKDLTERFEDIVGVTLYEDREVEHIIFWASDNSKDYIITKPIHESQRQLNKDMTDALYKKFPNLRDGMIFSLDCIPNYELIRELCSFGKDLIVLEPSSIKDEVYNWVSLMFEKYLSVRTLGS